MESERWNVDEDSYVDTEATAAVVADCFPCGAACPRQIFRDLYRSAYTAANGPTDSPLDPGKPG